MIADQPAENHRGRESEIRFEPPRRLTDLAHVFPGMILLQTYNACELIKSIDLSRIA